MRLWTLHPCYLDPQGLVALWREALLAKAVLRGETKGYRHHPQLERFKSHPTPRSAINAYLAAVLHEADSRGYSFDQRKVGPDRGNIQITATMGQLKYEWNHLMSKLKLRSPELYRKWRGESQPKPHPMMLITPGPMETWERPNPTR